LVSGGSAFDVMTTYGIGHTDAINSFWYIVEAINSQASKIQHCIPQQS
jgi:hypothetical protein